MNKMTLGDILRKKFGYCADIHRSYLRKLFENDGILKDVPIKETKERKDRISYYYNYTEELDILIDNLLLIQARFGSKAREYLKRPDVFDIDTAADKKILETEKQYISMIADKIEKFDLILKNLDMEKIRGISIAKLLDIEKPAETIVTMQYINNRNKYVSEEDVFVRKIQVMMVKNNYDDAKKQISKALDKFPESYKLRYLNMQLLYLEKIKKDPQIEPLTSDKDDGAFKPLLSDILDDIDDNLKKMVEGYFRCVEILAKL